MITATAQRTGVLDRLTALGEPTRARLLLLLEGHELTVSELCSVLQLPQSTVSRHLKALADAGWVSTRPEGTRRFYKVDRAAMTAGMRRLWLAVRAELKEVPGVDQDLSRLAAVLVQRRTRSEEFFSSEAGRWDRMRDELFGSGFYLQALPGFLDPSWVIGDLGCGTGQVAEALAPFAGGILAVDGSEAMLEEARRRLEPHGNVEVLHGDLEALPLEDGSLDAAVLALVLHHLPDPAAALREVARVVRPGGRVLVMDMMPHDREELAARMGHVWLGFSEGALSDYLAGAGFEQIRFSGLPANPAANGPALFAAAAQRSSSSEDIHPVRRNRSKEEVS